MTSQPPPNGWNCVGFWTSVIANPLAIAVEKSIRGRGRPGAALAITASDRLRENTQRNVVGAERCAALRLAALPRGLQRAIMGRVDFSHVLSVVARRRRIGALAQVVAAAVLVGDAAELPAAEIDQDPALAVDRAAVALFLALETALACAGRRRPPESGKSKLSFEYPDGPVTPRPERLPEPRRAKAKRRSTPRPKPSGSRGNDTSARGSVPKVPLVKV